MYPAGLLPPAGLGRRLAAGSLRAARLARRADRAGRARRRHALRRRGAARRPHGARAGLGRARRPREAAAARHRPGRERARGTASSRRGSTAGTRRRASSRKSSWASAACARCTRSASRRPSGTSTRDTPRSWCCSASATLVEAGPCRSRTRSRRSAGRRCSPRTRRCRPDTTRSRSTWSRRTWPGAWGSLGELRDQFLALGAYDNGTARPDVQHDGARPALGRRGQRGQRAAPRRHLPDVDADLARPGRRRPAATCPVRAITNGVHVPTWIAVRAVEAVRGAHRPRLAAAARRRADVGRHRGDSRRGAVGVRQALRNYLFAFIRERARHALDRTSASARARSSPRARCSTPTR